MKLQEIISKMSEGISNGYFYVVCLDRQECHNIMNNVEFAEISWQADKYKDTSGNTWKFVVRSDDDDWRIKNQLYGAQLSGILFVAHAPDALLGIASVRIRNKNGISKHPLSFCFKGVEEDDWNMFCVEVKEIK